MRHAGFRSGLLSGLRRAAIAVAGVMAAAGPLLFDQGLALAQGRNAQAEQALASNSVEAVTTAQSGSTTLVRVQLKKPLAEAPQGFVTQTPPRVALDLPGVHPGGVKPLNDLTQGEVRNVTVAPAGDKSRLVLALKRPARYSAYVEGNSVVVAIDPVLNDVLTSSAKPTPYIPSPTAKGDMVQVAAAPGQVKGTMEQHPTVSHPSVTANDPHAVRDIDFRRGENGEARIVIDLSSPQVGVDIRQQGPQLIVEFPKSKMPDNLRRRFDVSDFGTPIKMFSASQVGDNGRIVLTPNGTWEHSAYQSDSQFVVEVRTLKDDPNKLNPNGRGYRGEKLSLNFQNIEVRALLQVIADFTNLNIIASDSVTGTLTLRLKDVPWDQALDIVMQSRGLDMRRNGNVMWVAPREELAAKEKLDLEARMQLSELEPLKSEAFQLNYQKADALGKLLTDDKQRVLSKRGSAVVDQRTNQLFVQDTVSRLEEVRKLISKVDVPVRQVLIEARIVEADDRFSRNLGARLGYNDAQSTVYRTVSAVDPVSGGNTALNVPVYGAGSSFLGQFATVSGSMTGVQDLSSQTGSALSGTNAIGLGRATAQANTQFVNLPAAGISGTQPASVALSLFGSKLTRFVNLELSALEADQRGKVISSPRVLTADQGKAIIEQGTELPYQQATSSGATSVAFRKANLRLEVVPQITPEGNVILDVEVNRDAVGQLTPSGFAIDNRRVKTMVLVENGGTIVIGGIYEQFERDRTNKVPLLGDVPVVGYLFKNSQRTNDRTELLVFLTPRIVNDNANAR